MRKIIAGTPNPLMKCVESMLLKTKVEKIIKNPRLSDEEKINKIMTIIKYIYIFDRVIVY